MRAKYINPFTDYGFKKIFGEEASKPVLIDFLNTLLPETNQIVDLTFKNTEKLGNIYVDRKSIYDIYCENEKGEKFIVELQKARQNYFRERTIYYSTFPISEQAEKGNWNYNLKAVFCIGILDFTFDDYEEEPQKSDVVHKITLKNQHGKVFYDKLTYIYLEMPNFNKKENELETRLDKWLFFIKNLEDFQQIPLIFKDKVFKQAFEKANLVSLTREEWEKYEYSLKVFRDNKATYDYAVETAREEGLKEGIKEGIKEGMIETAKNALKIGLDNETIAKISGLSIDKIKELKSN